MKPLVWGSFVVLADLQLPKLHKVIQAVMGWGDEHLHAFDFGGTVYGMPSDEFPDDATVPEKGLRLSKALGSVTEFECQYDFGDNACPPEDVGGVAGYAEFREALASPEHDQYQDYRWVGGVFDPAGFDVNAVNARVRAIR